MTRFGDFQPLCTNVPSYPWCNLFYRQLQGLNSSSSTNLLPGLSSSPSFAPVGINPKCGIPKVSADLASLSAFLSSSSGSASSRASSSINWGSGSSLGNIANIVACGLSIPVILAVLYFVQKRKAAVGRAEMRVLFLVYGLTLVFQLLTTTSLLTQGSTSLTVLTSIHAGLIPTFFTILLFNASLVSTQFVDDGSLKSILPMGIVSLLFFAATTYVSLDTGLRITSGFTPNASNMGEMTELRNIPLFVLTSIYPLLCALLYFVIMSWIVLRVLYEWKPFFFFSGTAVMFVASQVIWFLAGRVICERTNAKLDSSFIATILETAAVVGLFLGWRSITEETWDDVQEPYY